jgi:hypothetical protein
MEKNMSNQFFADAITNVFVLNGLVRFELAASQIEAGEAKPTPAGTLVLPLNGFVNLHAQVDQIIKKMIEDGILKQADQQIIDAKSSSKKG